MEWEQFTGQELQTTDIVFCEKGGLANIGSGVATGEPTRIDSMPEAWTAGIECLDYKTGLMRDIYGNVFDRLVKFLRIVE